MGWLSIFLASLQILAKASPDIIAQFHGGAHDTANKVGAALDVVNAVTTNLAAGQHPLDGVPPANDLHPAIVEKAEVIAANLSPELDPKS